MIAYFGVNNNVAYFVFIFVAVRLVSEFLFVQDVPSIFCSLISLIFCGLYCATLHT